jgi:hypothetical protein
VNSSWLHANDHSFGEITVTLNQLLAKAADGDIEKVAIEDELFLHTDGANIAISTLV